MYILKIQKDGVSKQWKLPRNSQVSRVCPHVTRQAEEAVRCSRPGDGHSEEQLSGEERAGEGWLVKQEHSKHRAQNRTAPGPAAGPPAAGGGRRLSFHSAQSCPPCRSLRAGQLKASRRLNCTPSKLLNNPDTGKISQIKNMNQ